MKRNIILLMAVVIIFSSFTSALTINNNNNNEMYNWEYKVIEQSSNESFYDVQITDSKIIIKATKEKYDITEFNGTLFYDKTAVVDKDKTKVGEYNIPTDMILTKGDNTKIKQQLSRKHNKYDAFSLTPFTFEANDTYTFEYEYNTSKDYYLKFGNNSIIIIQDTEWSSTAVTDQVQIQGNWSALEVNQTGENYAEFDGVGDYINVGDQSSLNFTTDDFTISTWMKTNSSVLQTMVMKGDTGAGNKRYRLYITAGNIRFEMDDNGAAKSMNSQDSTYSNNEWYHVVAVRDGTNSRLYIDGVEDANSPLAIGVYGDLNNTHPFVIGKHSVDANNYWNGTIDDVQILNIALSATEVNNSYNLNRSDYNGSRTYLKGEWNFDDGSRYKDSSDYSNDGTPNDGVEIIPDLNYSANEPYNNLEVYYPFDMDDNGQWVDGQIDKAWEFAGKANTVINIGEGSEFYNLPTNGMTISVWVNVKEIGSQKYVVARYDTTNNNRFFRMNFNTINQISFEVGGNGNSTVCADSHQIFPFKFNNWSNIIGIYNGTHVYTFVDGVKASSPRVCTITINQTAWQDDEPTHIGAWDRTINNEFIGTIDEVKIYNRSLSDQEALYLYLNESNGTKWDNRTFLEAEYTLNKTFKDNSGNNNQGVPIGFDWTAYDYTIQKQTGTYNGNASSQAGLYDNALVLDGTGDYINIGDILKDVCSNKECTFGAWINRASTSAGNHMIIGKYDDTDTRDFIRWSISNNAVNMVITKTGSLGDGFCIEGDGAVGINEWTHVVSVWNKTHLTNYVDGVLQGTPAACTIDIDETAWQDAEDVLIGARDDGSPLDFFNGSIDDVMVLSGALTPTEINLLYINQSDKYFTNGTLTLPNQNINQNGSINRINISATFKNTIPGNVSGMVDEWELSDGYDNTDDGLVGLWHLDNNATDSSGNGNDGTISGNPTNVSGRYNSSYSFDGIADYINTNIPSFTPDGLSVCSWVNLIEDAQSTVVGRYDWGGNAYFWLYINSQDLNFKVYTNGSTAAGATCSVASTGDATPINTWNHICGVYDNDLDKVIAYVNGQDVKDTSCLFSDIDNSLWNQSEDILIGAIDSASPLLFFNGSIDEVEIYNRSLTSNEIKTKYTEGRANWQTGTEILNLTSGVPETFTIATTTENVLINLIPTSDTYNFYTPIIYGDITLETFVVAGGDNPPVSILSQPEDGNLTQVNNTVDFECNATDDVQLANVTFYLWNDTGVLINTNFTTLVGTNNFTNFTYNFTNQSNYTWNCLVFDNNSQSDWDVNRTLNVTIFPPTPTDSCTYSSGDWNIECSDNCNLSTNTNVGGNNITINGTGIISVTANITNFITLNAFGESKTNRCYINCNEGGCFK